jgi:hypothetical protein
MLLTNCQTTNCTATPQKLPIIVIRAIYTYKLQVTLPRVHGTKKLHNQAVQLHDIN